MKNLSSEKSSDQCNEQNNQEEIMQAQNFVSVFYYNNPDAFGIHRGAQEISFIKEILGIEPFEVLTLHKEDGSTSDIVDVKKFTIKGGEIFSGKAPTGGKSYQSPIPNLDPEIFRGQFGVTPKIIKEANQSIVIFNDLKLTTGEVVDMALEWPYRKRLLFSKKIATPKMPNANWANNYKNIMADGKLWQGVSLRSQNPDCPIITLASYLGAIL